jgi:hypothetical protein
MCSAAKERMYARKYRFELVQTANRQGTKYAEIRIVPAGEKVGKEIIERNKNLRETYAGSVFRQVITEGEDTSFNPDDTD